ncbi:MAG: glycosyltransferase family protein [Armatimonadetes bacterium]|nr:glycosyltransferase family protein [Armatimonadota bacterium]
MVAAILQARVGARRLPGKTLIPIGEHTLLGWTILAVKACPLLDQVIVATTTDPGDDPICALAADYGVPCFRGSEADVLDRFVQCAREYGVDVICRVSGDSPMWSPRAGAFVVEQWQSAGVDYAANCIREVYPLGVQAEVFSRDALEASVPLADRAADHEHATPALRRHYPRFSLLSVLAPPELERPQYRLCVDDAEDLAVVRELFDRVPHPRDLPPDVLDVCRYLDSNPELAARNAGVVQKYKTGQDVRSTVPEVTMPVGYRAVTVAAPAAGSGA